MTHSHEGGKFPKVTIRDTFDDKGFPVKEVTIDLPPTNNPVELAGLLVRTIESESTLATARRFNAAAAHQSPSHNGPQSGAEVTLVEAARHIKGGA